MKPKINIKYTTEKGTLFPSYTQALIADALEKMTNIYIEEYKISRIVEQLDAVLDVACKEIEDEVLPSKEPENETI